MNKLITGAVGAIVGVVLVGSIAAASGGIGGRPANPDPDNPRTQSIFVHTLERGESLDDAVIISNNSDETQTIELFAVDGTTTNVGAFDCRQNVEERTGLGLWTTLEQSELTLEPRQRQTVGFTIAMPGNADVGEHNACIVFQEKDQAVEAEGGVVVRTRQALRVAVTVPGELSRDIEITSFAVNSLGSTQSFTMSVRNVGNVSADVDMAVTVRDLFGNEVVRSAGGYPVLADQEYTQAFSTDTRPMFGGWYTVQGSISYDSVIGAIGVASDQPPIEKLTDKERIFLWPTLAGFAIIGAALAVIVVAILFGLRMLSRRRAVNEHWVSYTVKAGDTLTSIAQARQGSWKQIARVNAIKAPYTLHESTKLKVPPKK